MKDETTRRQGSNIAGRDHFRALPHRIRMSSAPFFAFRFSEPRALHPHIKRYIWCRAIEKREEAEALP